MRQIPAQDSPQMTDTAHQVAGTIRWTEGAVEVDAALIAHGLKLPVEKLMAEMRRGLVYSTNECGIGEDHGRFRLTFRYRESVFRLVVTAAGDVISEQSS